jgi:Protein of unknown function (DUF3768)
VSSVPVGNSRGDADMTPEQTRKVAELNDLVRTEMKGGKWVATSGAQATGLVVPALYVLITKFDQFTESNNPHGERDMGMIEVRGTSIMWKIDTYENAECRYGAEEPWDPDVSYRVLTILLPEEY